MELEDRVHCVVRKSQLVVYYTVSLYCSNPGSATLEKVHTLQVSSHVLLLVQSEPETVERYMSRPSSGEEVKIDCHCQGDVCSGLVSS